MKKLKIIIIEDFIEDVNLMKFHLTSAGIDYECINVNNKKDFEDALNNYFPDAILCDHTLPQFDSIRALKVLKKRKKNIPFILVTGSVSEEFAVQMIQAGAHDYIIKDRMTRLPAALMNALQKCAFENERLKYFEELISSEELFKKAEKIAHFGVWESNLLNGKVKWSDETYRILGFEDTNFEPTEEIFYTNLHPEDIERTKNSIKDFLKSSNSGLFIYRIVDKDGSIRTVQSEFIIERDTDNRPVKITGFNLDITQQMRAQQELLRSLKETTDYKYAIDESSIVAITDQKGIITHVNNNFCKISKYSSEELIGQDHKIISSGYHSKDFIKNLWVTIANGKIWKGELKNKAKDGTTYWVDTTIVPFLNQQGKPYQYIAIRADVTERKISEENLNLSERKFRQFFETAPEAVLILDIQKKVFVDFNENALKLLKYSSEQLMHKSPLEVTAGIQPEGISNQKKMLNNIERIVAGEKLTSEWLVVDSEGNEIFVEIRSTLLSEYDKNLMRLSVIDITDRKNSELERNKITADLFNRNKDLERFTYIVSHNLRSPVANILGFSEELDRTDLSEEERTTFLSELHNGVKRLDEVIIDLNEILNINNLVKEKEEEVFFSQVVENIKAGIKELIENNEVEIITDFKNAPSALTIQNYMHSIFHNMVSNSIKYRRPEVKPKIEITSAKENGKLILTFKDNGRGIDLMKVKENLFGLYKRFHPEVDGKGIGLFMVKAQVTALEGNISVTSEINKGTTFTIELNP